MWNFCLTKVDFVQTLKGGGEGTFFVHASLANIFNVIKRLFYEKKIEFLYIKYKL